MTRIAFQTPNASTLPFDFSAPLGDAGFSDATVAIELLHRDPESVLTLAQQAPGELGPRDFAVVRSGDVANMLPGMFAERLGKNGFFSINGFTPKRGKGAFGVRRSDRARRLNAAFVDVDNCDPAAGETALRAAVNDGAVPPPSVIVHSGRGMWAMWRLRAADDPALPPLADERSRLLYEKAQQGLQERLRGRLPGTIDAAVKDVARLTRVPGSINTKADRIVRYWPLLSEPTYTVDGLSAAVGVSEPATLREVAEARAQSERSAPATRPATRSVTGEQRTGRGRFAIGNLFSVRGARARWLGPLENFERLQWLRDGFRSGERERAAFALAIILRQLRSDDAEIVRRVAGMAAKCRPPLDPREQAHAIATSARYAATTIRQRNVWFAQLLNVTADESEFLPTWPSAAGARRRPDQQRRSRLDVVERRAALRRIVADLGFVPTRSDARDRLAADGFQTSRKMIEHDYAALKLRSGSRRGRRRIPQPSLLTSSDVSGAPAAAVHGSRLQSVLS